MQSWLLNKHIEFDGNLELLISKQSDFNPDKKQPQNMEYDKDEDNLLTERTTEYNISSHPTCLYLRRLEDIDVSWLVSYLENVIFGIQYNSTGSIKEYNKQHLTTYTFDDVDGEGAVDEKDLLTDELEHPVEDIEQAKNTIPYLLKRILEESKNIGISLMSMIIAYENAKEELRIAGMYSGTVQQPKPHHLLTYGIYTMDKAGNVGDRLYSDANKNNRSFGAAKQWLYSDAPSRSDASALVFNLMVLGIDIKDEDPRIYNEDYISKMTVTYISLNQSYVARKYGKELGLAGGFMRSVYDSLDTIPLEFYEETARVDEIDEDEYLKNAMVIFNNMGEDMTKTDLGPEQSEEKEQLLNLFFQTYDAVCGTTYRKARIKTYDGFLVDPYYNLLPINISRIFDEPRKATSVTQYFNTAIIHINGYLVMASRDNSTMMLPLEDAIQYLKDSMGTPDLKHKWEVISL